MKPVEELDPLFEGTAKKPLAGLRRHLKKAEGRGHLDLIKVRSSLYVLRVNAEFRVPWKMYGDSNVAKVRILLSGGLEVDGSPIKLRGAGAYLEVDPGERSNSYTLASGCLTRLVVLVCQPEFFSDVANMRRESLPEPLAGLFRTQDDKPRVKYTVLGPDLLGAANDIMRAESRYPPEIRNAYLSTRCQEIACAVVRDLSCPPSSSQSNGLSVRDVNRIYEVRDLIEDNPGALPTLPELSRRMGISETRLKVAFKGLIGMTMSEFARRRRMDLAAELLANTDQSIAEVGYAVGYDYPPNFTTAFRKHYGCNPTEIRKNLRATAISE